MDDSEAIRRVRAGDADAFRVLVVRYQRRLFALVRSYVRDPGLHEDLVQDAFLRAFEALARFDPSTGHFAPWLYAIARNRCRDVLRTAARRRQVTPPEARRTAHVDDPCHSEGEVERALATLSPERRTAFLLVEVHGFSIDEAAVIERVAPGTIKSRASRARAELRARLGAGAEAQA